MPRLVDVRVSLLVAVCHGRVACGRDRGTTKVDTAAGKVGVIDSAPAAVATTVAAILTDENVFALLDTAYSAMIATDQLAQRKTTGAVNDFAAKAVSENAVTRSGIKATAHNAESRPRWASSGRACRRSARCTANALVLFGVAVMAGKRVGATASTVTAPVPSRPHPGITTAPDC